MQDNIAIYFKSDFQEVISMPVDFSTSKTKENLMRAFAGESQARNRYTFAASAAKKQNLHVIEAAFAFTAGQEKEHAEVFYNQLKSLAGENINNMSKLRVLREDNISVKEILEKQKKIIDINEYKEIKEKAERKIKKNINFKPVSLPIMTFGTHEEKEYFRKILNNEAV